MRTQGVVSYSNKAVGASYNNPNSPFHIQTRREFLRIGSLAALSFLIPSRLLGDDSTSGNRPLQPTVVPIRGRTQLPILILWLQGGAPHFDMYDPHPDAPQEIKGPYNSIDTSVTGVNVSELLPQTASRLRDVALLRNIHHRQSDHGHATALALTGHGQTEGNDLFSKPIYNSAHITLSNYLANNRQMGITIFQANPDRDPYGGVQANEGLFIECEFNGPQWIQDGEDSFRFNMNRYTTSGRYLSPFGPPVAIDARYNSRVQLARLMNTRGNLNSPQTTRYGELFDRADSMLRRGLSNAFNLEREDPRVRDRYGRNPLGDSALLAKKTVEAGAKLILINDGFWDLHYDMKEYLDILIPRLDKAWSALFDDLKDQAIIVVASEFGRTPRVNRNMGRDHHPDSNCMLIAGPGIEPKVLGKTNNSGFITGNDGELDASLLGATILRAAGYELRDGLTNNPIGYYPIFRS